MICTAFDRRGENNLTQAQDKFQKLSDVHTIVRFGHVFLNGAFLQSAVSLQMQLCLGYQRTAMLDSAVVIVSIVVPHLFFVFGWVEYSCLEST